MTVLEQVEAVAIWRAVLEAVAASERRLDSLDAIGDGDLGRSLAAGCRAAIRRIDDESVRSLPDALRVSASTMAEVAASSMGTLVARALDAAAGGLEEAAPVRREAAAQAVQAFATTVMRLGKAQVGDKTMVDVLAPLAETVSRMPPGLPRSAFRERIADAVRQGVERTVPLRARKGRARWLGDASVGQPDAGCVAVELAVLGALAAWAQEAQAGR